MCKCHNWCCFIVMLGTLHGMSISQKSHLVDRGNNISLDGEDEYMVSISETTPHIVSLSSAKVNESAALAGTPIEVTTRLHIHSAEDERLEISTVRIRNESGLCDCRTLEEGVPFKSKKDKKIGSNIANDTGVEEWQQCSNLNPSLLVQEGFKRAVALGLRHCAELWCTHVQGSEARQYLGGTYHVIQLGYIAEEDHQCFLNLTRMVVLHHSWPMCSSDFICATNHTVFEMSASDCMPVQCRAAETAVFVFMILVSSCIVIMSFIIIVVIIVCPQFHKPKYYLRLSLASTDFIIGIVVCGHAAYNQWVGLTEVPWERFPYYSNLIANQLFRHVPNCLWGVSDIFTQISGFFVSSNMIISLYTLSLMSLDRYLLLTRTHYRSMVTSRRVTAAIVMSWCCGIIVPSLHFVYRPQKQNEICINYDTSSFDVHIINNESKFATADYKVYLRHAVPLVVTLVVFGLPVITLLVFSFRTLQKYNSYTRDHSVRQVKSALELTQSHCSLSRQVSVNSLAAMVSLSATATPSSLHHHNVKNKPRNHPSTPPAYKLKFTFSKNNKNYEQSLRYDEGANSTKLANSSLGENSGEPAAFDNHCIANGGVRFSHTHEPDDDHDRIVEEPCHSLLKKFTKKRKSKVKRNSTRAHSLESETVPDSSLGTNSIAGGGGGNGGSSRASPSRDSVLGVLGLRRLMPTNANTDHVAATIRRIRGGVSSGGERVTVRERDREITCAVLVNVVVFVFACFPLLAVGGWMMFLYFTQQDTINNKPPLKQLLFVAPWMMAMNSLWNAILHLSYNHKFRSATRHLLFSHWRKLAGIFRRRERYQE